MKYNNEHTGASEIIYYQNVCTWSYSFPWWTWEEWEKHIDWIALHGINLVLAPFQENIWKEIFESLQMTASEISEHFTGPAFLAWNRMGNIRGWGGPLPVSYIEKQANLSRKVINRLRSLGIRTAIPSFAGHVPKAFQRLYPNDKFEQPDWVWFPDQYSPLLYLSPDQPLFQTIGGIFLKKVIDYYGTDHIYFADPFNEMTPKSNDPGFLRDASQAIFNVMKNLDPNAIWLLQGWFFYNGQHFWGADETKAFLTAVPQGRIIVLDLYSDVSPQYDRTNSYYGQPFVWCMLHNFGGNLGMHGSVAKINSVVAEVKRNITMTVAGLGITMEGINQNHVMYEFLLKIAWQNVDHRMWFKGYYQRRYFPITTEHSFTNVANLVDTVYGYNGTGRMDGPSMYAVVRTPRTDIDLWNWYSISAIELAIGDLIEMTKGGATNNLLEHDLVDFTRQLLQNLIDKEYNQIKMAYINQDLKSVSDYADRFLQMILDMDRILASNQNFLLGKWYADAKKWIADDASEDLLVFNACNQVTLWGPMGNINNYAIKQWAGLIGQYAYNRWKVFFDIMKDALNNGKTVDNNKAERLIFYQVEKRFCLNNTRFPSTPVGNTVEIAKELFDKYKSRHFSHIFQSSIDFITS